MNLSVIYKATFLKFISHHKIQPLPLNESPKFLILMNQNIGDMIVCSPILRELKVSYPSSYIQVLASYTNQEVAIANPYIDNVVVYKNRWHKLLPLLLKLRAYKFDYAIELEAKIVTRVILMLKVIRPKCILSVSKREGRYGIDPQGVLPYDYYTNPKLKHQRDTCLDILRLLNIEFKNKEYDFFYLEKNKEKSVSFFKTFDSNKIFIGLNITGSSLEKRISNINVGKILLGLRSISSNIIVFLLHKPEDNKWVNEFVTEKNCSFVIPTYPTLTVLDVAAIVNSVDLLITPDTSLVHMACAFNKPLLAIYRNDIESFEVWKPKSKCNSVIFSEDFYSLNPLNIDAVINKSSELLSQYVEKDL
jgi:ADP-heptose:LPS heptosyltransferase